MSDIDTLLHNAGDVTPADTDYAAIGQRGGRRRTARRAALTTASLAMVAIAAVAVSTLRPAFEIAPVDQSVPVGDSIGPWSRLPDAPGPVRTAPTLRADGDLVLLVGGDDAATQSQLTDAQLLDLSTGEWTTLPDLPPSNGVTVSNLVIGGGHVVVELAGAFHSLTIGDASWEPLDVPAGVTSGDLLEVDDQRLVLRHHTGDERAHVERLDWDTMMWTASEGYLGSDDAGLFVDGDRVWLAGGAVGQVDETLTATTAVLDIVSGERLEMPDLPTAQYRPSIDVTDGQVLIAGGFGPAAPAAAPASSPEVVTESNCDGAGCASSVGTAPTMTSQRPQFPGALVLDPAGTSWTKVALDDVALPDGSTADLSASAFTARDGFLSGYHDGTFLVVDPSTASVTAIFSGEQAVDDDTSRLGRHELLTIGPDIVGVPGYWTFEPILETVNESVSVEVYNSADRSAVDVPFRRHEVRTIITGDRLVVIGGRTWQEAEIDNGEGTVEPVEAFGETWILDLDALRP